MLKKFGMVAVAATAGLLALSPIAFAHDDDASGSNDSSQLNTIDGERNQLGLVNTNDNNVNVPVQACGNVAANTATDATTLNPVTGILGSGILGNEAGDASSAAECEQGGTAGEQVEQVNGR